MNATTPEKMWALRAHEPDRPDRLSYEEMDVPSPAVGDVLVQVHAASFTPTELEWPATWFDRAGRARRPVVPGHEMSGVVVDLGYGTSGFAPGDGVWGITDWYRDGAAAEYVAVEARNLTRRPESVSHVESAATPLAGLTAWQALFVHGGLTAGQSVLVLGAGGGVGSFAVQLAYGVGAVWWEWGERGPATLFSGWERTSLSTLTGQGWRSSTRWISSSTWSAASSWSARC